VLKCGEPLAVHGSQSGDTGLNEARGDSIDINAKLREMW
jgi:hypothetical protein